MNELRQRDQWVAWDYVWRLNPNSADGGRWDKPPINVRTGRAASCADPATWASYDQAAEHAKSRGLAGVGYVLTPDDDLTGIDLDHCRDKEPGELQPHAAAVVALRETYAEVSPSGRGLRLFARGAVDRTVVSNAAGVELYAEGRYLTVTGHHIAGSPAEIRPAPNTLASLLARVEAAKAASTAMAASQIAIARRPVRMFGQDDFFRRVNSKALAQLASWFPVIFPAARLQPGTGAWRVASAALGRDLEEDLSASPDGIVDFGVHDMSDPRSGKRSAIDVVIEHGVASDSVDGAHWLCQRMGVDPASLGWRGAVPGGGGGSRRSSADADQEHQAPGSREDVTTQDGVALTFARIAKGRFRYCNSTGAWFCWDGSRWRQDQTQEAFQFARTLAREASEDRSARELKEMRKVSFATAIERYAQGDPSLAVTHEAWDQDPMLLGTPSGTVDLATGEMRKARPEDGITKVTSVGPGPSADCPVWLRFLDEATQGDAELVRFLQQWCGYCLTGLTQEHALVFVYGGGGNGKSVFLNTLTYILNDYAATAAMDTFAASRNDRHSTELAMLRGARLVTASETEEGRAWAEARIKQATGGDWITARFMRQDNFTYRPAFKLLVVGNHKPALRNVDEAARRRFNIVPFIHRPVAPDSKLGSKLQPEGPGILRWMINGCLDWQQNGMVRPKVVQAATSDYFADQDLFQQWVSSECHVEAGNTYLSESPSALYASWAAYAREAGEDPGTIKALGDKLENAGCPRDRTKSARLHRCVELQSTRRSREAQDGRAGR